jgi:hypothetical protein
MFKTKTISIIIGFAVIGGLGYFFLVGKSGEDGGEMPKFSLASLWGGGLTESSEDDLRESGAPDDNGLEVYQNQNYGFSFRHLAEMSVSEIPEDTGFMVLVQSGGEKKSFQIFVLEYDEPGPITPERIKRDLPRMNMENPTPVKIGTDKTIDALIFFSDHPSLGKTREIWFVWPPDPYPHGNYLYQITTYADMDNFIGSILDTWKF